MLMANKPTPTSVCRGFHTAIFQKLHLNPEICCPFYFIMDSSSNCLAFGHPCAGRYKGRDVNNRTAGRPVERQDMRKMQSWNGDLKTAT